MPHTLRVQSVFYSFIMADKESNFVKLNETNYTIWKFGVNIVQGSAGLSDHVNGTEAEPDKATELEEWKKWSS